MYFFMSFFDNESQADEFIKRAKSRDIHIVNKGKTVFNEIYVRWKPRTNRAELEAYKIEKEVKEGSERE